MSTYKYDAYEQLTAHFNSREFRCKCNSAHDYQVNDKLATMLEELYNKLDCSKIIINSGFRCPPHSVLVGGYAGDEHTLGNAADIVCYDKTGKVIDSRKVCCAAQDLDFPGIGRIDYSGVHVDVSTRRTWRGDELGGYVSKSIPGSDFYSYFGIQKAKKTKKVTLTIDDHTYSGLLEEV